MKNTKECTHINVLELPGMHARHIPLPLHRAVIFVASSANKPHLHNVARAQVVWNPPREGDDFRGQPLGRGKLCVFFAEQICLPFGTRHAADHKNLTRDVRHTGLSTFKSNSKFDAEPQIPRKRN